MDASNEYYAFVITSCRGNRLKEFCLTPAKRLVTSRVCVKASLVDYQHKLAARAVYNYRVGDSVLVPSASIDSLTDVVSESWDEFVVNLGPCLKKGDHVQAPGHKTSRGYHQSNSDIKSVFHTSVSFGGLDLYCSLLLKNTKITEVIETRQPFDCRVKKVAKSKNIEHGTVVVAEPVDENLKYKGNEVFVANMGGFFVRDGKAYNGLAESLTPTFLHMKYPALERVNTYVLVDKEDDSAFHAAKGVYILENCGVTVLKENLNDEELRYFLHFLQEMFTLHKGRDHPFVVVRNCPAYKEPEHLLEHFGFDAVRLSPTKYSDVFY
ncbi:MAG: hypothetical protein V1837_04155 [Candidatus Woesearchaeota archaeon]